MLAFGAEGVPPERGQRDGFQCVPQVEELRCGSNNVGGERDIKHAESEAGLIVQLHLLCQCRGLPMFRGLICCVACMNGTELGKCSHSLGACDDSPHDRERRENAYDRQRQRRAVVAIDGRLSLRHGRWRWTAMEQAHHRPRIRRALFVATPLIPGQ